MKVGLFFGSFNPIHIGHVAIGSYMAQFTDLNEVWFVVSPHNPLKNAQQLLAENHRFQMVERALESYSFLKASNVEFSLSKPSYTVVTLAALHEKYPDYTFVLLMGGDTLETMPKWKHYAYILKNYEIYVYSRPEYTIPQEFANLDSIKFINSLEMSISSSFIRNAIKEGKNVKAFMPIEAWAYLDEMNFYKTVIVKTKKADNL